MDSNSSVKRNENLRPLEKNLNVRTVVVFTFRLLELQYCCEHCDDNNGHEGGVQ